MWTCPNCGRIFEKFSQPHSCKRVPLEDHFRNKILAKELFENVVAEIHKKIGPCKIISLPCCVHLFGTYDFLAALPKKNSLEIRFALHHELQCSRIIQRVPLSATGVKNCMHIFSKTDVDEELLGWVRESYHLKDN
jgi:hypothetical protein